MGLFGSGLWGGAGGGGAAPPAGAIKLGTGILNPAFRIAGITKRPMRTPSPDQYAEAVPVLNRLFGSWDTDRLNIFTVQPSIFPLVANQLEYTIGPGGNFNVPAPEKIEDANVILAGSPPLRQPLGILDEKAFSQIRLQLIPGAIPTAIYPDYDFPLGNISVYPQCEAGLQLELYMWQVLPVFSAVTDAVVLPLGYERAMVLNLAVELALMYPLESELLPGAEDKANMALAAIQSKNAPVPRLTNDASGLSTRGNAEGWNWWRTGGYGS